MTKGNPWPEILIAVQDALRQAEREAARREGDSGLRSTSDDRPDKLGKIAREVEQSILARQSERTSKLEGLETLIQETERLMAESQGDLERWLDQACPCSQALMNGRAPAI